MAATPTRSRVLHSREKELIYYVNKYFLEEKAMRGFIIPPSRAVARTAKATNVSEITVKRICSKHNRDCVTKRSLEQPEFTSPKKRRCATVTNVDDFDQAVIRRTVSSFYERQELPTISKIAEELKEKDVFHGSKESLRRIILQMGFKYAKVDGRKFLMERPDVVASRARFLREMQRIKQSHQNIVYLDETWINQNYTVAKCWTDTTSPQATGVKQPTGKGSRLIILHAGTRNGFVPNAELVFQAKNDGDYHNQMNAKLFQEWFANQLLPNISPNSVIVMDNASYHSVQSDKKPTSSWRKADIKDWLLKKGVHADESMVKPELYDLAKKLGVNTKYVIDTMAEAAGHKVVRLPPYHCQYNPIELIWAQVKTYVAKATTFKMADLKNLVKESLNQVTRENWTKAVRHAEGLQEEDTKQVVPADKFVDSLQINLSDSSDDEDSD